MMENAKYIAFYALLLVGVILGAIGFSWLVVFPFTLILSGAFIAVKGRDWRRLLGENQLNPVLVFVAVYIGLLVLSAIGFGIGALIGLLF